MCLSGSFCDWVDRPTPAATRSAHSPLGHQSGDGVRPQRNHFLYQHVVSHLPDTTVSALKMRRPGPPDPLPLAGRQRPPTHGSAIAIIWRIRPIVLMNCSFGTWSGYLNLIIKYTTKQAASSPRSGGPSGASRQNSGVHFNAHCLWPMNSFERG